MERNKLITHEGDMREHGPQLKIKRLHPRARTPIYATAGAACFDLHACLESETDAAIRTVTQGEHATVTLPTGLAFEVPPGFVMLVFSRSGQGFKDNTRLANCVGVIDSDYRGEVRVKLTRDDSGKLFIRDGDRVAQAMLIPVMQWTMVEVDELSGTERGTNGYGSTGK